MLPFGKSAMSSPKTSRYRGYRGTELVPLGAQLGNTTRRGAVWSREFASATKATLNPETSRGTMDWDVMAGGTQSFESKI